MLTNTKVAYFSMEIGLESDMPTYSGGLGVLAGDTIRSAADLGVPMVAVTLLHRRGYFSQQLDHEGNQTEGPAEWCIDEFLEELPPRVVVEIGGHDVVVRAWSRIVVGARGARVPVIFLDTNLEENREEDRAITDSLYGGDERYRLRQETVLGTAGVRMLRALGARAIERFHMNEGHASLLGMELLHEALEQGHGFAVDEVRRQCVFTTHTPVPAGHDRFGRDLVREILGGPFEMRLEEIGACDHDGTLNMTQLALTLSGYVNGVAKRHGEVSREMFPGYAIDSITNGVHLGQWTSPSFQRLFDDRLPGWRTDNAMLRLATGLPEADVRAAHDAAKQMLMDRVNQHARDAPFDPQRFTIAYARRSTAYKRPSLLFSNLDWLREIVSRHGSIQIVYAGKAHPRDFTGKDLIRDIHRSADALRGIINVVYLPGYDMELAGLLVAGADLWLNTPEPPKEASGTSGMKAAANGVPSLSTLDGWWLEGCIEGQTGWAIDGYDEAATIYHKLDTAILPAYADPDAYARIRRNAIAVNASFFNTERMVREYVTKAYFSGGTRSPAMVS